jgi:hypothetical protein
VVNVEVIDFSLASNAPTRLANLRFPRRNGFRVADSGSGFAGAATCGDSTYLRGIGFPIAAACLTIPRRIFFAPKTIILALLSVM